MRHPWIFSTIICLLSLGAVGPSKAEWIKTYYPIIIDTSDPETLYFDGEVNSRLPLNLGRALEKFPNANTLFLDSPGGDVHAGLEASRTIDRHGLTTIIPEESGCYSACTFLFFAGASRYAYGGLGVHQARSSIESNFATQMLAADILSILKDYDVNEEVYSIMFSTPPDDVHVFTEAEKQKYRFLGNRTEPQKRRAAKETVKQPETAPQAATPSPPRPAVAPPPTPLQPVMTHVVAGLDANGDGFLALRAGTTSGAKRLSKMVEGTRLEFLGKQGVWYEVRTETGLEGWAHSNWISRIRQVQTPDTNLCDALWTERNSIYARNGYCFKSERGQSAFSNAGCIQGLSPGDVQLSANERAVINELIERERQADCR
ncbi:SH3 domain-containing protein [Roseovarius marisflavi]|uniref:SH3 domain-containing protein n=1 Tax=Roseovarius marisflavi TaxID=1054996 RepID=A0A1M6WA30_9RHOB|nr:YARHG domain-containing protein [Roseovarius marisflavi]SHK90630.1 SH3 domain-containing protein [Roseovarius marisflavi]